MDIKNTLTVGFDLEKGRAFVQEWETEHICGHSFSQVKETIYFRSIPEAHDYVARQRRTNERNQT
jgi:hypothetical protein